MSNHHSSNFTAWLVCYIIFIMIYMSSSFRIRTNKYNNIKKTINENKKSYYRYDKTNVICSTIYMNTIDSDCNNMIQEIHSASIHASSLQLQPTFHAIFNQQIFRDNYWQKNPFVIKSILNNLKDAYRMDDVKKAVERDFFDAGRGTFQEGRSGWNMAVVSEPRGSSFQEAKLQYEDILVALQQQNGTVVINSAGGFIPELAMICYDIVKTIKLPVAVNMYLTNRGQRTSAPPHTDKQDVFVLQTSGYKHWKVYKPPIPSFMLRADPYARGKMKDVLSLSELEQNPIIDVTLGPGQVLYVPAGYPHTTDTIIDIPEDSIDPSIHLTIGVDTLIWSLTYAGLRSMVMKRAGIDDKLIPTKLPSELYWKLHEALPLGILSQSINGIIVNNVANDVTNDNSQQQQQPQQVSALIQQIAETVLSYIRQCEPQKWSIEKYNDDQLSQYLNIYEVTTRMISHHHQITNIFMKMYEDVAFKLSPAKFDLSFFRSQPYFQELEQTMVSFNDWAVPPPQSQLSSSSTNSGKRSKVRNETNKSIKSNGKGFSSR